MKVTYKNAPNDLFEIYWYRKFRSESFYVSFLVIVTMILMLRIPNLLESDFSIIEIVFSMAIYIVTWFVLYILFFLIVSKLSTSGLKVRESLKRTTITFQDDGFVEETSLNTNHRKWAGIVDIRQNNGFIFLYVERSSYYAIPKRAFSSPRAAEDFYQTAYNLWQAAKK